MPRQVMNHRKRSQDEGMRFENGWPKNLMSCQQVPGHPDDRPGDRCRLLAHVLEMVDSECRYLCRLSLLSFEKHAMAGMSIAKKLKATQNAAASQSSSLY
jgi:hypothetical protein